jgi:hypothetical protein
LIRDWTKSQSYARGQRVECEKFLEAFKIIDPSPVPAEKCDQIRHIDLHTKIGTVDVKAMKRVTRSAELQEEYIWVEFRCTSGLNGWLFGEQDWIAFESMDGFTLVLRKHLLDLCNDLCDTDTYVNTARKALYKAYQRRGEEDVISMIKFKDLYRIPHFSIRNPLIEGNESLEPEDNLRPPPLVIRDEEVFL